MINEYVNNLKAKIVSFSYHVENMLTKAIEGLSSKNLNLLNEVIDIMEPHANNFDNNIEKKCIATIAQFSPKALNLRLLLMILKMNKDLERMADHCVNISHHSIDIINLSLAKRKYFDLIYQMAEDSKLMLNNSIKSFIDGDIELAKNVKSKDKKINKYQTDLTKYFLEQMRDKPNSIDCAFHFIQIVNNLERIADLSTNIAENTVFIFQGKIIKH